MRPTFWLATCLACAGPEAGAGEPALSGATGLIAVPSAEVQAQGTARIGWSAHNPRPDLLGDVDNWHASLGFLPNLEIGGRVADSEMRDNFSIRDLSFNAKYRVDLPWGAGIAVGATDIGGEARFLRSTYVVGTLPVGPLRATLAYGSGPDVLEGLLGGLEYRPWHWLGLVAEHDGTDVNAGLKLSTAPLFGRLRIGATAAHHGATREIDTGLHVDVAFEAPGNVAPARAAPAASAAPETIMPTAETAGAPVAGPVSFGAGAGAAPHAAQTLAAALRGLGFESVRVGQRGTTQVVRLEDRRHNHSSADGIGLALGAIAHRAAPGMERIELTTLAYGVPQLTIEAPVALYREYLADAAPADALRAGLVARPASRQATDVSWSSGHARLRGAELVLEPVLRTFVATEYGVLDHSLGARARVTAPLWDGVMLSIGAQVPVLESDDFGNGRNFDGVAREAGADLAVLQHAFKLSSQWLWLASLGRTSVLSANLDTVAVEQQWSSGDGRSRLRLKVMALHDGDRTREVALAGYAWFDPARDYGVSLTGGRFYAGDSGLRLDLSRYFGDVVASLFLKAASRDDQAAGMALSFPLTPRRDAAPSALQIKGTRRWSHALSTTLNGANQSNALRPLLLHEPMLDLDLERDFDDGGRLGQEYLREELPRMREAWQRWGDGP